MSARCFAGWTFALLTHVGTHAASFNVPPGYRQVAAEYGIPPAIFYAVALTESGRTVDGAPQVRPWPWTLNIGGRAHYFTRRAAAEQALAASLNEGVQAVDVGLMQVNWYYHQARLKDPKAALDPYRNLRTAAAILRNCRGSHGDWWVAVGCYHAPSNPDRALAYRARVTQHWQMLQEDR